MKLKAIASVCALAFAGQAFAAGPTPSVAAASNVNLFISGSSALQNTIGQIATGLFTAGSISVFWDSNSATPTAANSSGKDYRAYAGTFSAAAGTALSGKTGVVYETAKGGSFVGVIPVAQATGVLRLDLSADTNCVKQTLADPVTGADQYACQPTTTAVPDAGVSDVEPAMFVGINVPPGSTAVTPAIDGALTKRATLAQPMGIILTPNLVSQGVTNLSKAQVTALMAGLTTTWDNLDFFASPAVPAGPVIVCKRTAGSGTQASINDFFFGVPCSISVQSPKGPQGNGTNYTVIENSSSGALAACMTAAQKGLVPGATTTVAGATIDITSGAIGSHIVDATHITLPANGRAIGLMGLDRPASTFNDANINGYSGTGTDPAGKQPELYSFVSIGGVIPSVLNATLGAYDVVVNNSWNSRAGTVGTTAPMSGDQLAFYNAMASKSGDPAILGTTKTPAVKGVAALSDPVALNYDGLINADGTLTNPAMRVTKANSCQPAVQNQ